MSAAWVNEVRAEFVMDFYGGFAKIEDSDVQVWETNVPQLGLGAATSQKFKAEEKFKNSFTVGGRVTYWTQRFTWLGAAFDGSYFKADAKNGKIEIPVYGFSC